MQASPTGLHHAAPECRAAASALLGPRIHPTIPAAGRTPSAFRHSNGPRDLATPLTAPRGGPRAGQGRGAPPSGFRDAPSGFHNTPSGFRDAPSGFRDAPSGFRDAPSGFRDAASGFRDAASGFHDGPSGFRDAPSGFPDAPSGFHNAASGFHDAASGFHDAPLGFHDGPSGFHDGPSGFHDGPSGFRDGLPERVRPFIPGPFFQLMAFFDPENPSRTIGWPPRIGGRSPIASLI